MLRDALERRLTTYKILSGIYAERKLVSELVTLTTKLPIVLNFNFTHDG